LNALRALVTRGPSAARRIIGETLAATQPKKNLYRVTPWDLCRAFATPAPLVVQGGDWMDGGTEPIERLILALLLRHFKPATLVEIGTYRGATTRLLLDNLTTTARIFTMDLPLGTEAQSLTAASDERLIIHRQLGVEYLSHPGAAQVTQILGDSFQSATWRQIPDGVEFAFIDASHSYEAVKNDTEKLWPKLSPRAIVLWHDYSESETSERGVGRYLRELMPRDPAIFLCEQTRTAYRIPVEFLQAGEAKVARAFPDGSFAQKHPGGIPAWRRTVR
jgi:predicted O-methyltransferase YrrM